MTDGSTLIELDARIAALRANIDELTEQAAAYSGAGDEERTAERLADQQAQLAILLAERDVLAG
ncbi:MAG TPA: hypothetical protein VIQ29_06420 [Ancylobacter sp.]